MCAELLFVGHGFSTHDAPSNKSPLLSHKTSAPDSNMTRARCSESSLKGSDSGSQKSLREFFENLERFGRALIDFEKPSTEHQIHITKAQLKAPYLRRPVAPQDLGHRGVGFFKFKSLISLTNRYQIARRTFTFWKHMEATRPDCRKHLQVVHQRMAVKDLRQNVRFSSRDPELKVLLNGIVARIPNVHLQREYGVQSPNTYPPSPSRREGPGLSTQIDDARVANSTSNTPSRAGSSSARSSRSKRGTSLSMIFTSCILTILSSHLWTSVVPNWSQGGGFKFVTGQSFELQNRHTSVNTETYKGSAYWFGDTARTPNPNLQRAYGVGHSTVIRRDSRSPSQPESPSRHASRQDDGLSFGGSPPRKSFYNYQKFKAGI